MSTGHSENSSRKRQRTSEEPSAAAQKLIQDEVVWYGDGNIVVRAGPGCTGEGPIYGFKCHRSILASKSKVFETMLQLPEGGERTVIDGIPVVDFPDPWEDVRDFVRMMYGALELPVDRRSWRSAAQIAGALKLATKYDVADMADSLLGFLQRDWPSEYFSWAQVEKEITATSERLVQELHTSTEPFFFIPHINSRTPDPAFVVKLVQDVRAASALKAAWYELARSYGQGSSPFSDIHSGFNDRRSADLSLLDADDLRTLVVGRERMNDVVARVVDRLQRFDVFFVPKNPDSQIGRHKEHPACVESAQAILKTYTSGPDFLKTARDPLGSLLRMERDMWRSSSVCASCKEDACDELVDASSSIWDLLVDIFDPKAFGLESVPSPSD